MNTAWADNEEWKQVAPETKSRVHTAYFQEQQEAKRSINQPRNHFGFGVMTNYSLTS